MMMSSSVNVLVIILNVLSMDGTQASQSSEFRQRIKTDNVTVNLGTLRVTNRNVELRCEITNGTSEDVWICAYKGYQMGPLDDDKTDAEVFMGEDDRTLLIARRIDNPGRAFSFSMADRLPVPYVRLHAGQSRAECITVSLPLLYRRLALNGFAEAMGHGVETVTRMSFVIGYFSGDAIKAWEANPIAGRTVRFEASGEKAWISGRPGSLGEKAVTLTVDGFSLPYSRLLNLDMAETPPNTRLTLVEKLRDLFYGASIDLETYRYAVRLFECEEALGGESQEVANTFARLADGKMDSVRFNELLGKVDRERLLNDLETRQGAIDKSRNVRIDDLMGEAKRHDNSREGHEALVSLRRVLRIDPLNDEAFSLLCKIGAYYKGKVVTNSVGMKFAWIPQGEFTMGKHVQRHVVPQHKARITRSIWMGTRKVSQAQYEAVMGRNPSRPRGDDLPVNLVSQKDAEEFCRKLSEKEGKTYRLPTEAEWEYACRAGTTTDYWWGDDAKVDPNVPNPFGLLGMNDRIGEWCLDWFDFGYYSQSPIVDPEGPKEANPNEEVVVRGSGKAPGAIGKPCCPSFARVQQAREAISDSISFRVVLEDKVEPEDSP
jgi:formylglycine-generating enzyme required for sulfatase activity